MDAEPQTKNRGWRQSRYGLATAFGLCLIIFLSLLRVILFTAFHPAGTPPISEIGRMFLTGLQRDFTVALLMTLPLLGWFFLVPERWFPKWWHRVMLGGGLFLFWFIQIFLVAAEFFFFEEFRSRYNTVAVDYLLYPHEVFINIWDTYPVVLVVAICAALSLAWVFWAFWTFSGMWMRRVSRLRSFAIVVACCALFVAMASTLSLKSPHVSQDRIINEMANNGALSFFSAFWTRHLDYAAFYKTLPQEEAWQRARKLLEEPGAKFTSEGQSIERKIEGDPTRPRLNVVIFLEESLGSEFWGSLGSTNANLTPEMDRLAGEQGLLFTNLFASGNRTVRGFEGVLSSFPPLPGDSIVKRDLSDNVETIARVLKRDGYSTLFLYGGRGLFDGMRSFTMNNGYDRFIEQKNFEKPTFSTIWGVCDEDVFKRAIEEFRELDKSGKPFLGTILSVSNHKPYTYPTGRIPEDPNMRRREHAVKYSDYCLGQFFAMAKKEAFWTNTVFAVVADHGARVYGSQSVPIHSYEIPLVIAGPAVVKAPQRIGRLGGSLDVSPTILGLIGRPYTSLFFGRDMLKPDDLQPRAYMNHNRDIALYARERLVVLGLMDRVEYYTGDPKKVDMAPLTSPTTEDVEFAKDAMALYQIADILYMGRRYHLDP
jgi:phosphoglycerol transferase MdoB-like AlkP superfamily enzyme